MTVGVPLITPVEAFKDKPAGSAGLIEYVIAPTKFEAVKAVVAVIAVFCVALSVCVVGDKVAVAAAIAKLNVAVAEPEVAPVPVIV